MKKFVALLLAAVMLLSMTSVFAEAEKTTLTMWCIATESDANRPAYEAAIAAFEAAHPDIKIEWEAFENQSYKVKIKAAMAVNAEMLRFYFRLGGDIARMEASQPWGSGFLKRLSRDLKAQMPEANCFSVNSLIYMRCFHQLYASIVFTPQVGGRFDGGEEMDSLVFRVPWGHHKCIIDKFRKEPDTALFYVRETIKNGWSRAECGIC